MLLIINVYVILTSEFLTFVNQLFASRRKRIFTVENFNWKWLIASVVVDFTICWFLSQSLDKDGRFDKRVDAGEASARLKILVNNVLSSTALPRRLAAYHNVSANWEEIPAGGVTKTWYSDTRTNWTNFISNHAISWIREESGRPHVLWTRAHTLQCLLMMQLGSWRNWAKDFDSGTRDRTCVNFWIICAAFDREITHPMAVYVILHIPIDCGQKDRWQCASSW